VKKMLFDYDPNRKMRRDAYIDGADVTIDTQQDITDLKDLNKAAFNEHDGRSHFRKDMVRVASIPMNLYMELDRQGIARDDKALLAWLDRAENSVFRTAPGRLS
jgi:hypothetical protein